MELAADVIMFLYITCTTAVQVHKCGIKQYDDSSLTLWQCSFSNCQHAIMTAGTAQCFLEGCHILDCNEDGIIGLEQSTVHLTGCFVTGCKGPGIDMSDRSAAKVKGSEVKGCCGGIWLWDCATCEVGSAVALHSHRGVCQPDVGTFHAKLT